MSDPFFAQPILNSPYACPARHWELDANGQPTQTIVQTRRAADFITPIPKPRKARATQSVLSLDLGEDRQLSNREQAYSHTQIINTVRRYVDDWRKLPCEQWRVTAPTARLLAHWREHPFSAIRPFFCQVEAVETAIWLHEVAPLSQSGKDLLRHIKIANENANPGLVRLALKLATGAGKTTVMAMLIAWQTLNAVRAPGTKKFTRGFLIVAPGITVRERLALLHPNHADSYYQSRELVPRDMLADLHQARIVITNYHAFKRRERVELSKGGRRLLQGRSGAALDTLESEGQMLVRVIPELMGLKNILVLNDEAHHCYREKPASESDETFETLSADNKAEAEDNNQAARLWISGLEAAQRKLGLQQVIDLSATPFFLAGSGYAEGTLFPWVMSDFSLMDAIECGIVKLPRVPVADNIPGADMPIYRDLWQHIGKLMPKKGRRKSAALDPQKIPPVLQTALDALYGHYAQTFHTWQAAGMRVPPCFIVVCNNTASSKLVYDYIAGCVREHEDGSSHYHASRFALFANFDEHGNPCPRPNTLLIDSEQLESGDALDKDFRHFARDEIECLRRDLITRTGNSAVVPSDEDLLREAMNTVGKPGRLGESIRCVVSVSMLTEGWDANTVTHILGVRAFGTQLLCEQVIGRALRRQSYALNDHGLLDVEYADIFGIPFDFAAHPVIAPPQPPRETITVKALSPERDTLEIRFPRVQGYRVERAQDELQACFTDEHILHLNPTMTGPTRTKNAGIIGESVDFDVQHLQAIRPSTVLMRLTQHLIAHHWRAAGEPFVPSQFIQLKRITRQWLQTCLACEGGTTPAQLLYPELADRACARITRAITAHALQRGKRVRAILDPFNPAGSTRHVQFNTSRDSRWDTAGPPPKNQINWVVYDSGWEAEFCRVAESHPQVLAYTKNHGLGLEVPYSTGATQRSYYPDFILKIDTGTAEPLNLIVEIKGYRGEDAKDKKSTMETYWIPGVNALADWGRWAFAELTEPYTMQEELGRVMQAEFATLLKAQGSAR